MQPLANKIAVVAGATRGAGRGIACMLGAAGATVYCTGRSTRTGRAPQHATDSPFSLAQRAETIEETAELVGSHGGVGIAVRVDHTVEGEVRALFERVTAEQGRLDILVNDVWGGDELSEWGKPFWELSIDDAGCCFIHVGCCIFACCEAEFFNPLHLICGDDFHKSSSLIARWRSDFTASLGLRFS